MRRQFDLPEEDTEYLDATDLKWETVIDRKIKRVIIYDYPIPLGYNLQKTDLNVRIEATYPDTQIDMVYFHPHLKRADGKPIGAIAQDNFDGKDWQRWSRHRTGKNPWRPGLDNLSSHIALIGEWLLQELKK